MKPSSFNIFAIATFNLELGIATVGWLAIIPFRMRVSMSAIGSETLITTSTWLPGRLHYARDFSFES
jgi:hypothetical protein